MNSKDLMYGNLLYYDNTQIAVDHNVINRIGSGEPHFKPIPISDHRLRFNGFHPDGKIYITGAKAHSSALLWVG